MVAAADENNYFLSLLLAILLQANFFSPSLASSFGVNYGQVADNLPSPPDVIPLFKSIGVSKVKLYDSDPAVLNAFSGTSVEFTIGLPDRCIKKIAGDPSEGLVWVKYNILPYLPGTKITSVTIGNEVLTNDDKSVYPCLLPAMKSVHSALASLHLDRQITVTTAHSLAVLATSYPPSSSVFKKDIDPYISEILDFLIQTDSPFLVNTYPYFAYKDDPKGISLDYVMLDPKYDGVVDPATNARYKNMLHAQVDAVDFAMVRLVGKEKARCVKIIISETGWPSKGDPDEAGATIENAKRYNRNLVRLVEGKKGTPMRSGDALMVYVFAMFNENLKPGPASERNYGLFNPDGTPVYKLSSHHSGSDGKNSTTAGVHGGSGFGFPNDGAFTGGYYSISSATKAEMAGLVRRIGLMWASSQLLWMIQ
ncbi:Beta-1,3-endoglucanase, family GH17 [Zostera marina]|uniref:glucan endo-1,3-beta-D-glucosidase n=1 Tax=Zostera marina TaxID=29655 RepID=A0A0K9Q5J9_ZOSMR|nr:Beta-1,3-endoglucanase, family GH17 [Zostera marina]